MIRIAASEPTDLVIHRIRREEVRPLLSPIYQAPAVGYFRSEGFKVLEGYIDSPRKMLPVFLSKIDKALFELGNEAALKTRVSGLVSELFGRYKYQLGPVFLEKLVIYLFEELLDAEGRDVPSDMIRAAESEATELVVNRIPEPEEPTEIMIPSTFIKNFSARLLPDLSPKIDDELFTVGTERALKVKLAELLDEWLAKFKMRLGPMILENLLNYLFGELLKSKGRDAKND
jgi:hypothetical protein